MVLIVLALIAAAQAFGLAWIAKISKDTTQVNHAVNNAHTGMPTLVQRVIDQDARGVTLAEELARTNAWRDASLMRVAHYLGVTLPPPPHPVEPTGVQLPSTQEVD